jgi:hypothetical protein
MFHETWTEITGRGMFFSKYWNIKKPYYLAARE